MNATWLFLSKQTLSMFKKGGVGMYWKIGFRVGVFALGLAAAGVTVFPTAGYSQTQGMERRDDRRDDRQAVQDTRQTGRQEARDAKDECLQGDEKSRAECRQQKRQNKQDTREDARDIR
jgi:hypothetical protein